MQVERPVLPKTARQAQQARQRCGRGDPDEGVGGDGFGKMRRTEHQGEAERG